MIRHALLAITAVVAFSGCATNYGPQSYSGGFADSEVRDTVWSVAFYGNGFTTRETIQTYWLYHCADLALKKGYDGFRILSEVSLAQGRGMEPTPFRLGENSRDTGGARLLRVQYAYIPDHTKPSITAQIQLLRHPFKYVNLKAFDAVALKASLEPYVNGNKCEGNVCPHIHTYLYPELNSQRVD